MKRTINNLVFLLLLGGSSAGLYFLQISYFHRTDDTLFYLLQDTAFVPVHVIIVTLVFNEILNIREKRQKLKKTNVIISTFFAEAGTDLIRQMAQYNTNFVALKNHLNIDEIEKAQVKLLKNKTREFHCDIHCSGKDLMPLLEFLVSKKPFLLAMLENPNLLEHDSFTDMLWAVFHLSDELQSRDRFDGLPQSDLDHLSGDIRRAYILVILEWFDYIKYLKSDYPYLHSLAMRKSPFSVTSDVRIFG